MTTTVAASLTISGQPAPTGIVTFNDGATTSLGTATVISGAAALSTSTLAVGSHTITAVYSGDGSFNPNTGLTLTQTVTGAPAVTLSPTDLNFGSVPVGVTSPPRKVTFTNTGSAELCITAVYALGDDSATTTCGTSLAPGSSCTIKVTFKPKTKGSRPGSFQVSDNAADSPQKVKLSGTGT